MAANFTRQSPIVTARMCNFNKQTRKNMMKTLLVAVGIACCTISTALAQPLPTKANHAPADFSYQAPANEGGDLKTNKLYFSYGFGFPALFELNLEERIQRGQHELEMGVGITPIIVAYEAHIFTNYLYHLNTHSGGYVGLGLRSGFVKELLSEHSSNHDHVAFYVQPNFVLGKFWNKSKKNNNFLQLSISPGVYDMSNGKWMTFPLLTVSKGFDL